MTGQSSRIPQPRANIGAFPPYVPGNPPVAREGLTTYKLSSNENPYPPLPGVVEAVSEVVSRMNRYPDMGNVDLFAALATRLDVPVEDLDRQSVVSGKSVSVRVDLGVRRLIKKKT